MTAHYQRTIFLAALLLGQAQQASANTTVTVGSAVDTTALPYTFGFAPITDATELLSASDGTFSGGEGGSAAIVVDYADNTTATLFSATEAGPFSIGFPSVLSGSFFPEGTIDGLTFSYTPSFPGPVATLHLPAGTQFVFAQAVTGIAEPWSLSVVGASLAGLAVAQRRRRLPGGKL